MLRLHDLILHDQLDLTLDQQLEFLDHQLHCLLYSLGYLDVHAVVHRVQEVVEAGELVYNERLRNIEIQFVRLLGFDVCVVAFHLFLPIYFCGLILFICHMLDTSINIFNVA